VSPNDGQPYEILWGVDISKADAEGAAPAVVAYERQGVGGKRYVLLVGIAVRALTAAEFARAHFPRGHQPPASG
jgi:hypothetical protein